MKNFSKITSLCILITVLELASALSIKNRLKMHTPGTVTQYPKDGDIIILENKNTGKCLDMDTDGGLHLKSCKGDTDEKWTYVKNEFGFNI